MKTKKYTLIFVFLILMTGIGDAQSYYHGIPRLTQDTISDLDNLPWVKLSYGSFANPEVTTGSLPETHKIFNTFEIDPVACVQPSLGADSILYTLPNIPDWDFAVDGSVKAMRLGDAQQYGVQSSRITYYISPSHEENIVVIYFASILQNPDHPYEENPIFTIEVVQENDQPLLPLGDYSFVLNPQGNSEQPNPDAAVVNYNACDSMDAFYRIYWINWLPVAFNLKNFEGENLKLRITVKDCIWTAHFAYVYFTPKISKAYLTVLNNDVDSITLVAPAGFVNYKWTVDGQFVAEGVNRTATLPNILPRSVIICEVTSATGAVSQISFENTQFELEADFYYHEDNCDFTFFENCQISYLHDPSSAIPADYMRWDFGDGTTSLEKNPTHRYDQEGDYTVSLTLWSPSKADSVRIQRIIPTNFNLTPPADITGLEYVEPWSVHIYETVPDSLAQRCEWNFTENDWGIVELSEHKVMVLVGESGTGVIEFRNFYDCGVSNPTSLRITVVESGITDISPNRISIAPNPISDYVKIKGLSFQEKFTVSIINMLGKVVLRTEIIGESVIHTQQLPPGIYLLQIQTDGGIMYSDKLIKY